MTFCKSATFLVNESARVSACGHSKYLPSGTRAVVALDGSGEKNTNSRAESRERWPLHEARSKKQRDI